MVVKSVSHVSAWIIAAAVSVSVAAIGIYINSAPIVPVSSVKYDYSYQSAPGVRCDDSRITGNLRAPARSNDWNIIADGGV